MAEEKERKEMKKEEKPKPSLFSRLKKPLMAGVITAGLLFTPMKNVEGYDFGSIRGPPQGKEWIKRIDTEYSQGWKYITDADRILNIEHTNGLTDKAISYFKKKYEENKDDDALYLYAYSYYLRANDSKYITEAEYYLKKTIEVCNIKAKTQEINEEKLALKLFSYYGLGYGFFSSSENNSKYIYKKKAKEYLLEGLKSYEQNKDLFDEEEQKWFEEEGPVKSIRDLLKKIEEKN